MGPPDATGYGSAFAASYDEWYPPDPALERAVDRLAELAGPGPVLELGVGTGRVALPLAARGLEVWGIDASADMLDRLAAKDPARLVTTVRGDMAELDLPTPPRFTLVFAAFNTFYLLATEAAQRACLRRCHDLLAPGGHLALELYVPAPAAPGHASWTVDLVPADPTAVVEYRRAADDDRVYVGSLAAEPAPSRRWALRPLPVAELDRLAGDADLTLEHRWRSWDGDRFFERFGTHVSVWRSAERAGRREGGAGR